MKGWNYQNEIPFIPVKLIGKNEAIEDLGIVDSGAGYCVLHERIAKRLELDVIGKEEMIGFGSKKRFPAKIGILSLEINGVIENVNCAIIGERYYPEKVPKIVLGRNLLNKFRITLDGKNKKIYLE